MRVLFICVGLAAALLCSTADGIREPFTSLLASPTSSETLLSIPVTSAPPPASSSASTLEDGVPGENLGRLSSSVVGSKPTRSSTASLPTSSAKVTKAKRPTTARTAATDSPTEVQTATSPSAGTTVNLDPTGDSPDEGGSLTAVIALVGTIVTMAFMSLIMVCFHRQKKVRRERKASKAEPSVGRVEPSAPWSMTQHSNLSTDSRSIRPQSSVVSVPRSIDKPDGSQLFKVKRIPTPASSLHISTVADEDSIIPASDRYLPEQHPVTALCALPIHAISSSSLPEISAPNEADVNNGNDANSSSLSQSTMVHEAIDYIIKVADYVTATKAGEEEDITGPNPFPFATYLTRTPSTSSAKISFIAPREFDERLASLEPDHEANATLTPTKIDLNALVRQGDTDLHSVVVVSPSSVADSELNDRVVDSSDSGPGIVFGWPSDRRRHRRGVLADNSIHDSFSRYSYDSSKRNSVEDYDFAIAENDEDEVFYDVEVVPLDSPPSLEHSRSSSFEVEAIINVMEHRRDRRRSTLRDHPDLIKLLLDDRREAIMHGLDWNREKGRGR